MQNKSKRYFAIVYVWMAKAKYTMAMLYIVVVYLYLLGNFTVSKQAVALDLRTSLEMMVTCLLIGLSQKLIVPLERLTLKRSLLWLVIGICLTAAANFVFQWFMLFPLWYNILFIVVVGLGMMAMLLAYYFELQNETIQLNKQLEYFQSSIGKNRKDG